MRERDFTSVLSEALRDGENLGVFKRRALRNSKHEVKDSNLACIRSWARCNNDKGRDVMIDWYFEQSKRKFGTDEWWNIDVWQIAKCYQMKRMEKVYPFLVIIFLF